MSGKIIIVAQGGLANRMRAIASGLFYADKVGRDLSVVWYRNGELNASFSELFKTENLPFEIIEPGALNFNLQFEEPRKKNLFVSGIVNKLFKKKYLRNIHQSPEERIIETINGIRGDVIINSGYRFADFDRELFTSIFHFSDKVRKTSLQILQGRAPEFAIQIRRTDNQQSIAKSPLSSFEEMVIKKLREHKEALFFLATDDADTKNYFYRKYPDNVIMNHREARRDTAEGMVDAAAEMLIMAQCNVIYGSYWSSFSEMAALYGGKELIVIS